MTKIKLNLNGTKTEQNLINSFAGECQARMRYDFFAKQAKKDGFEQIAEIFTTTANNEKEHAKLFYKHLGNISGKVDASYPFELGTTEENLKSAIQGEHMEWESLYANGAKVAQEEGFDEIAETFLHVIEAEKHHEKRYAKLLKNIENNTVFNKDKNVKWLCRECGYIFNGKNAPEKCPNCHHPQSYYEILCENY